jgi:hypothetical protein
MRLLYTVAICLSLFCIVYISYMAGLRQTTVDERTLQLCTALANSVNTQVTIMTKRMEDTENRLKRINSALTAVAPPQDTPTTVETTEKQTKKKRSTTERARAQDPNKP